MALFEGRLPLRNRCPFVVGEPNNKKNLELSENVLAEIPFFNDTNCLVTYILIAE